MRVMITGGAGFIGSAVCRHFILELGHEVVVVDKLTYAGNLASLTPVASSPHYAFEKLDICDAEAIRGVFSKYQPAAVVHLAAESHVDRSISGSNVFIQTNVVGTFNLLEAAREYLDAHQHLREEGFRFIHVSTDEVYGSLGRDRTVQRNNALRPELALFGDKGGIGSHRQGLAPHLRFAHHRLECSNNYGPYQFPEKLIP